MLNCGYKQFIPLQGGPGPAGRGRGPPIEQYPLDSEHAECVVQV